MGSEDVYKRQHFKQLAHMGAEISFAMDGLEDTNHIYRRGVDWNKVKTRFQTFIEEGGKAQWQWIEFPHNKHQIDEGRRLAEEWGFDSFDLRQRFTQDDLFDKSIVMASSQPVNLNSQHKENALDKQRLVTDYQEKIEKYKGLKKKSVLVVSERGYSDQKVIKQLKKMGFEKVESLRGGMHAWMSASMPTKQEKDHGKS